MIGFQFLKILGLGRWPPLLFPPAVVGVVVEVLVEATDVAATIAS